MDEGEVLQEIDGGDTEAEGTEPIINGGHCYSWISSSNGRV